MRQCGDTWNHESCILYSETVKVGRSGTIYSVLLSYSCWHDNRYTIFIGRAKLVKLLVFSSFTLNKFSTY